MRIAGLFDPDDNRPAAEVARERGLATNPFQGPRIGEKWAEFAIRAGITRQQTAKEWWELNQKMDEARGLPRDPEPDWADEKAVRQWDHAPWLTNDQHEALRLGQPFGGVLATHLGPWEKLPSIVQPMALSPPPPTLDTLFARATQVDASLAFLQRGTGNEQVLPMQASTVGKYLAKGAKLAWDNKKVILKSTNEVIDLVNAANTVYDVAKYLNSLAPHVNMNYLPVREYQFGGNWTWRWPDGSVTSAPPP